MMLLEEEKQLVLLMQIVDQLRANEDKFGNNEQLAKGVAEVLNVVEEIFRDLPEEERNRLLELYKEKLDYLRSKKKNPERKK